MRYGGYVLFAIPIFLLTSMKIEKYVLTKKIIRNITIFFVILSLALYNARNISRLVKESDIYQYDLAKSPYFFVENVSNEKTAHFDDYEIYSPKNGKMCWASKTPCSYNRTLKVKNFLWMKMVY